MYILYLIYSMYLIYYVSFPLGNYAVPYWCAFSTQFKIDRLQMFPCRYSFITWAGTSRLLYRRCKPLVSTQLRLARLKSGSNRKTTNHTRTLYSSRSNQDQIDQIDLPGSDNLDRSNQVDDITGPNDWDRGGKTEKNSLTPLYASMKVLIDKNPGCVCLIQVGSFYELYFEQAEIYGLKLGLKVATRKTSNYSIPMAGFPIFQLQKFVKMLVQDLQENVAIIDQYPSDKIVGDKIIHRKVSRIITPGTLVDETFVNYNENNYLLAISFPANCTKQPYDPDLPVGLSWIDLSVGDFYVQLTTLQELISDIARINPSEIIISKEFLNDDLFNWFPGLQDLKKYFLRYHKTVYNDLKLLFKSNLNSVRKIIETFTVREESAMNMILSYINVNLPERNPSLDLPVKYWNEKYLQMDSRTRDALELIERHGGISGKNLTVGSLLNTIKRTLTPSGTRLLTEWIKSPILDVQQLKHRQNFVKFFLDNPNQSIVIKELLSSLGDYVRSGQRLALGTGDIISNLKSISQGLTLVEELREFLQSNIPEDYEELINNFLEEFNVPVELAREINDTFIDEWAATGEIGFDIEANEGSLDDRIIDSGPSSLNKYRSDSSTSEFGRFVIREDYSPDLATHHGFLKKLRAKETEVFTTIKDELRNIDDRLLIQIKPTHGKFNDVIYINGKNKLIDLVHQIYKADIREKRKNSILYKPNHWKYLQVEINQQLEQIKALERVIINKLRDKTVDQIITIRRVNKLVDFLDITLSFSNLTKEFNLTCPSFSKSSQMIIENGRHIVVESSLKNIGGNFVNNNTKLTSQESLWVITGPNMGGKSTFLRQNALIVILAQIGCFVPATKCTLGIVDKLFTRIGASDDLFNDLSTFMVEMMEVSNILKNATKNSLAIVDEVGRGTSGKEGLAIAYSTLVSLLKVNKCRTLFATHFGNEILQLLQKNQLEFKKGDKQRINVDRIKFFKTRIIKQYDPDDTSKKSKQRQKLNLVINHRLEEGISEKSYAIEVAQLAGFPKKSLEFAYNALKVL